MRTFFFTSIALLVTFFAVAQKKERFISTNFSFRIDHGLYDRTLPNNRTGFGAGLQFFLNGDKHFKQSIEINADAFGGTKQLFLTPDGKIIDAKKEVVNIMIGSAYVSKKHFFTSLSAGPSFFNNHVYLSVKPTAGYFITPNKKVLAKVSFINTFQRDEISDQNFGYLSFSIGIKLL